MTRLVQQVQYPDVSRLYETDLGAMAAVAWATKMLFPDIDIQWMVEEFKTNVGAQSSPCQQTERIANPSAGRPNC